MELILVVSSVLLWIVVLFNLLLTIAIIRRGSAKPPSFDMTNAPTLEIGSQAPDFAAHTLDGKIATLDDYVGKSVALIFISPSCKPCLDRLPELYELAPHTRRHSVELVLVSIADEDETKLFVESQNITLPVLIAPRKTNAFMHDYKVAGTPFICVLDKNGKFHSISYWGADWQTLASNWTKP